MTFADALATLTEAVATTKENTRSGTVDASIDGADSRNVQLRDLGLQRRL
jgi:hypothetical protein